jgi:hypothetical protein
MRFNVDKITKIAQSGAIVIGIFGAVGSMSYNVVYGQYDRRVAKVTELGKDYSVYFKNDYLDLMTNWGRHVTKAGNIENQPEDEEVKRIVYLFFESADNERKLVNVLYFFDMLSICVNNRSCDRNSALDLFDKILDSTYGTFFWYIAGRRETFKEPSFGAGLEFLHNMEKEREWARLF